jgi:alpha/beta superfamily hydrolase
MPKQHPLSIGLAHALASWSLSPPASLSLKPHRQSDNFTSMSQLQAAVEQHDAAPGAGLLHVHVVEGADHFFADAWDDVAAVVQDWLAQQLAPGGGGDDGGGGNGGGGAAAAGREPAAAAAWTAAR